MEGIVNKQHIAKSPPPPPNPPSTTYLPYHPPTSQQGDHCASDPAGPDPSEFAPIANALSNAMHPITSNQQSSSATLGGNTSPAVGGKVERTKTGKTLLEVERPVPKVDKSPRWCRYCEIYKPDRTHHCRHCGTCVMQFDRESVLPAELMIDHCVWLGQCVGWANHKVCKLFSDHCLLTGTYTTVFHHLQFLGRSILSLHPNLHGDLASQVGLYRRANDRAGCYVSHTSSSR